MAITRGSDMGGHGAGFIDGLGSLVKLGVDSYATVRSVDNETTRLNNMPDIADQQLGDSRVASSDSIGGIFKSNVFGMPLPSVLVGAGVLVGGAIALKKFEVI